MSDPSSLTIKQIKEKLDAAKKMPKESTRTWKKADWVSYYAKAAKSFSYEDEDEDEDEDEEEEEEVKSNRSASTLTAGQVAAQVFDKYQTFVAKASEHPNYKSKEPVEQLLDSATDHSDGLGLMALVMRCGEPTHVKSFLKQLKTVQVWHLDVYNLIWQLLCHWPYHTYIDEPEDVLPNVYASRVNNPNVSSSRSR
jgi:hypothetical protein